MYIFKHENQSLISGTQRKMGTPHAMEITYKFYNVPQSGQQAGNTGGGAMSISRPESVKAAHNMAEMWSTFATMEIDTDCRVVNDPYPLERKLWERLDP